MKIDTGRLYTFAWRNAHRVPEPILRALFTLGADIAWAAHGKGVVQLEKNLARVRPGMDRRGLRRLSRQGMRSYMRYFREVFTLRSATPNQIRARVRYVGAEGMVEHLAGDTSPVLALLHQGNWDLAGAFATPNIAPVLTVAERLEPEELFEDFVAFRASIGIEILALGDGDVFRKLLRACSAPGRIVPLLADRDLSASGVEVDLFGERARVAAGPGAIAVATGTALIPVGVHYERLHGERRRAAGTAWGIVLHFFPAVTADPKLGRRERVAAFSQAWVDVLAEVISAHPQDWHMLQKVFVADLDPERYARTRRKAGEGEAGPGGEGAADPAPTQEAAG